MQYFIPWINTNLAHYYQALTSKVIFLLLTTISFFFSSVNALACEQKDEIMTQLKSIRRLMKESGLDKSENKMKGTLISSRMDN